MKPGPRTTLTKDMKAYQRAYHAERRQIAKRLGICTSCDSDPAVPGKTKCADCARIQNQRKCDMRRLSKLPA